MIKIYDEKIAEGMILSGDIKDMILSVCREHTDKPIVVTTNRHPNIDELLAVDVLTTFLLMSGIEVNSRYTEDTIITDINKKVLEEQFLIEKFERGFNDSYVISLNRDSYVNTIVNITLEGCESASMCPVSTPKPQLNIHYKSSSLCKLVYDIFFTNEYDNSFLKTVVENLVMKTVFSIYATSDNVDDKWVQFQSKRLHIDTEKYKKIAIIMKNLYEAHSYEKDYTLESEGKIGICEITNCDNENIDFIINYLKEYADENKYTHYILRLYYREYNEYYIISGEHIIKLYRRGNIRPETFIFKFQKGLETCTLSDSLYNEFDSVEYFKLVNGKLNKEDE